MTQDRTVDALAIGAHPDDAEFGAAGTLLCLAALGYRTGILDMTRGEMGTRGTPAERAAEAEAAAGVLGLAVRECLDLGDGFLRDTDIARVTLVRAFRLLRPRLVFTHYWDEPHPDHVATASLVRHAVYLAGLARYDGDSGLERHRPNAIAHFGIPRWVPPSFVVDISAWAGRKAEAIACHKSQLYDPSRNEPQTALSGPDFLERLEARQRYYGALVGARDGEAFLVREAIAVADPVAALARPMHLFY
jgi:bacillithiol biosynthesis deacetylase BshB1